jgi:prepilin-type N-terminal cleavage/methylation domain-containing protein
MKKTGFTLLETLVAVGILSIGIAGPIYAASQGLISARNSANRLTASYLAQEGIEAIRQARDDAFLTSYPNTSTAWSSFMNSGLVLACSSQYGCVFDQELFSDNMLNYGSCSTQDCAPDAQLYLHADTGMYDTYALNPDGTNAIKTPFSRVMKVQFYGTGGLSDPYYATISVTVTWNFKGSSYTVSQSDLVTSWL